MPRRYRRRNYKLTRPVKITKYSNETYAAAALKQFLANQVYYSPCIPSTPVLGTRKVKNFTLTLAHSGTETTTDNIMFFALLYIPEGTAPQQINFGKGWDTDNPVILNTHSLYEPNQNVILQGFIDTKQVYRFKTRLARNLNSGDMIVLAFAPFKDYDANAFFSYTLNYAMAY